MFLAVFALNFKPVDECSIWGEVVFHLFAVPLRREVRAQQRSRSYKEALRFSPLHWPAAQNTNSPPPLPPPHLITVTFFHFEISRLSNLLFSFLLLHSLSFSTLPLCFYLAPLASSILLPHWDLHSSSSKLNPPASMAAAEIPESEANAQSEYEKSVKSSSLPGYSV